MLEKVLAKVLKAVHSFKPKGGHRNPGLKVKGWRGALAVDSFANPTACTDLTLLQYITGTVGSACRKSPDTENLLAPLLPTQLTHLGKEQLISPVLGNPPTTWKTQTECLTPGFNLTWLWLFVAM